MPGFFSSTKESSFFTDPKKVVVSTWAAGTFILLIPTCLKLATLSNQKHNSKSDLNEATGNYNAALKDFGSANDNLDEAKQRVIDLDCAINDYRGFNNRMSNFQQRINGSSTLSATDRLSLIWDVNFTADTRTYQQQSQEKSWSELAYRYEYYYGRHGSKCGNKSFCYAWDWHYVRETHYYTQITRIENLYKNIVEGDGVRVEPLDCGYYSRVFQTLPAENYVIHQDLGITSGNRESGIIYTDVTRHWGSRVPMQFRLDDTQTTTMAITPIDATKTQAANALTTQLYQFLAASIAAFNITGINYPKIQQQINSSIPHLIDVVHQANKTVQENALVLAEKQQTFENADDDFKAGLSLWLPLFFLIPGGLALLAYAIMYYFKPAQEQPCTNDVKLNDSKIVQELEEVTMSSSSA